MSSDLSRHQNESYPDDALAVDSLLDGYRIKSILGRGTFGITYLATEVKLDRLVAIKEYLPQQFADRDDSSQVRPKSTDDEEMFEYGRSSFLQEAKTLVKFRHPNIVRVLTFFEQNQTAYLVMEYEEGLDLSEYLKQSSALPQDQLLSIFLPIIQGLSSVHQVGFIHRDIKPANIYIRHNNSPVLLDFGATQHMAQSQDIDAMCVLTEGYAPYEQDNPAWHEQGPWTDVYALGATLYMAVMGHKPVDAAKRWAAVRKEEADPYVSALQVPVNPGYTEAFLEAIDSALSFHPEQRPQDLQQWVGLFELDDEQARILMAKHHTIADNSSLKSAASMEAGTAQGKFWRKPATLLSAALLCCALVVAAMTLLPTTNPGENHQGQGEQSLETAAQALLESLVSQAMVHAKLAINQYATAKVTRGHIEQYQNLPSTSDRSRFITELQIKLDRSLADYEKNIGKYIEVIDKLNRYPKLQVESGIEQFLQQSDYRGNRLYQQLGELLVTHVTHQVAPIAQLKQDLIDLGQASVSGAI